MDLLERIRRVSVSAPLIALFLLGFSAGFDVHPAEGNLKPNWRWTNALPGTEGVGFSRLEEMWNDLLQRQTKAFLVVRNEKIAFERYAAGFSAETKHYTASLAKALVGGLSTALTLNDARLSLDDPVSKYVSQWATDPAKSKITIRQLGSHSSGLADAEESGLPHEGLTGWKGDFWKRLPPPNDPFTIARDITPLRFDPGSGFQYSNPGIAMLAYVLTAALQNSPHQDLRSLLRERIMRPIGVNDSEWSIGYGQTVNVQGLPIVAAWGGGSFTARAVARVGRLVLRKGDWNGGQLIAASAVEQTITDAGTPGSGGIGWWSNNEGKMPKLPRDAFWGAGAGHQVLLVVPSLNLIAVRNGEMLNREKDYDSALRDHFFDPLMEAVDLSTEERRGQTEHPPSAIVKKIEWAPKQEIIRQAKGSDNWPLTWGDDDRLYTAYGDGNGFEPFVPTKLSLGLARISGSAADFIGENLRSSTIEQKGDGKAGRKASGILIVEGVLYMWVRNAGNSQLAWSGDHGANWTWADWKFTSSFGCPTFLNFGRNYSGARDAFVYVYSPDTETAYEPVNRFVLARVPKEQIRVREAYEFLKRIGPEGHPVWTSNITERGAVFTNPGECYRSSITYNPGLKRYLWCQTLPDGDARFAGGFAIYDAPEPWGPWTTAFHTRQWDVGPGETSSLPTKWMSSDGKTVHLAFSGDDCFSVRRATIELHPR